jgi:FkbM family methyltransferase
VTSNAPSLKPAIKRLLRALHLEDAASRFHWRLNEAGASIALFHAYRKSLGAQRGTKLYIQLHLRRYRAGSIVSLQIDPKAPPLMLRAGTVDVSVFEQVFVHRQYDFEVDASPDLIIDGGAHIGCTSVFFALKFPRAVIYSIEPATDNFALLQQNLAAYRNSIPLRAALWSKPAFLAIADASAESWTFRVAETNGVRPANEVLAMTIGEIVNWTGAEVIDILKLDIEGSEKEIFAVNPQQWMSRVRNLAVELHDRFLPGCEEALQTAIAPYRFSKSINGECTVLRRNDRLDGRVGSYDGRSHTHSSDAPR